MVLLREVNIVQQCVINGSGNLGSVLKYRIAVVS